MIDTKSPPSKKLLDAWIFEDWCVAGLAIKPGAGKFWQENDRIDRAGRMAVGAD